MPSRRSFLQALSRLSLEPPLRLVARELVRLLPFPVRSKAKWDVFRRPEYLFGTLKAAEQAKVEGHSRITVVELGVAGGKGLLALQEAAARVQTETGVQIMVYGFDTGSGLPDTCGDYRDHIDAWQPSDFPMDQSLLESQLGPNTRLVLGDVDETMPPFLADRQGAPLGFVAFDLDLWSSTTAALKTFEIAGSLELRRTWLYFDDVDLEFCHSFAGELLAISEFNDRCKHIKIDRARGIREARPFQEHAWLDRIYVAHNLEAISRSRIDRPPRDDHWHSIQ